MRSDVLLMNVHATPDTTESLGMILNLARFFSILLCVDRLIDIADTHPMSTQRIWRAVGKEDTNGRRIAKPGLVMVMVMVMVMVIIAVTTSESF